MSTADDNSPDPLDQVLSFLFAAGDLKDTERSGFTNAGATESTAEHTWRLALFVLMLEPYLEGLDITQLLKLALVHDLGEAVTGDVPAIHQTGDQSARQLQEREALASLAALLPASTGSQLRALGQEYDEGRTPEARLLKGLDKLETIHQHATGKNPEGFDYEFNLDYGAQWTRGHPVLESLRAKLDVWTKQRSLDPNSHPLSDSDDSQKA